MVNTPDAPSGNHTSFISAAGDSVNVPDAKLMFTGDYSRSGENLVLTGDDGASLVVGGYFASQTPATLVSPSGSILTGDIVEALAGPMFPGQYAQAGGPEGAQPIGTVVSLSGTASAKRANGLDVELKSGDPVFQGDVIQTGADSAVGMSFADKSVFNMSANARMVLNEFVYDAGGSSNKMLFNFVEGTFSFVSGQVAPNGDMKVQTPVAVMAIRGTAPVADLTLNQGTINFYLGVLPGKAPGSYNLEDFDGNVLVVVNDPTKGVTLTGASGTPQVFEVTGENLVFLQNLTQQLIETIEQSQSGPEESPEDLLKKITGSPFFEQFEGFDGVGPEGSGPDGSTPFGTIPLPEPITLPDGTQTDAFLVISTQVVPPQPEPDVVEPPTLVLAGDVDPDGTATAKEDGEATIIVNVAAAEGSNDVISQIVISGLDPDAAYMINGIELEPGVTEFTLPVPEGGFGAATVVTIDVLPGEDSDVDLSSLTVTATAQDGNSPNLTADASVTVPIVVDAVLDEFLALTGDEPGFETITINGIANEGEPVPLGLSAVLNSPGFQGSGDGGTDGDSSELVTMTVTVSQGGVLKFADLTELGIQVDTSVAGQWTFTGTTQSLWNTLAQSFAIDPDDQFGEGQITATFSTQTQEANTPEGEVPASGGEPDVADNTANSDLTVTLNVEVAEQPTLTLAGDVDPNGTLTVKEDGSGTIIVTIAAAAGSDDVISEIKITGLDPNASYVINGHEFSSEDTTFTLPVPEGGFGADETVTIEVIPGEDTDIDLSSLTVTATTQDTDLPGATASASATVPIVVDAVLDQTLELAVEPPNFYELLFGGEYGEYGYQGEYGSAPDGAQLDSIPLGLASVLKNAGFQGSLDGGTDGDKSEQVAMTVAISAGGILMFTDVQALGIQVDTSVEGEWTFTGTTQSDWNTLVDSFAVTPADGFNDGEITATFSIQTQEANTPEGNVAASGGEPNVADNTANFDLTLTLDIQPQGEELLGLNGGGDQIRLAFFSDQRANPDNFDYDRGGTVDNGADRDSEWEDVLGGGDLDFNDLQFNVDILVPDVAGPVELQPTTDFGVNAGDLVYELPTDTQVTVNVDNLFSNAGFNSTLGFYLADENGTPLEGYILVPNVKEPGVNTASFTIDTSDVDPSAVLLGFFIIPDGYDQNDLDGVEQLDFAQGDLGGFVAVDVNNFSVTASTEQGVVWEFDPQTYEYVNNLSNSTELPVIAGTDAENVLSGTQGDEIVVGFGAQDTLTGNGGSNLFVLTDLAIHDLITDFGQDDAIDVGSFGFSLVAGQITEAALEQYVRYISPNDNDSDQAELGGSAGDLFINVDGTGDPADFTLAAQLQNTPDTVTVQVDDSQGATNEVVIA